MTRQQEFEALYLSEFDRLARRAGRNVADEIEGEDIVARAFVELWEQDVLTGFDGDLTARLNARIMSRCQDYWKKHRSKLGGLAPQTVQLADGEEDELPLLWMGEAPTPETVRFTQAFDGTLRGMPEAVRDAFILTELRGLTVHEAATVSHTSERTLARRVRAARNILREEIDR